MSMLVGDAVGACNRKPPPVPRVRTPGEPFFPKSAKEAEMESLLKSMEGLPGGPGMKMYSREDLKNMQNFGDEDAEEEDDDDDEEQFPSKLVTMVEREERGIEKAILEKAVSEKKSSKSTKSELLPSTPLCEK